MNKLNLTSIIIFSALITGCASNSGGDSSNEVKPLSTTPYVWDDSKSEALNVAYMAQRAGVAYGMKDFDNGYQANEGKKSGAMRVFDNVVSGLALGVTGIITAETTTRAGNDLLDWRTSIVDFYPVPENSEPPAITKAKIRDWIGNKIVTAIGKEYSDLNYFGTLEPIKGKNINSATVFFSEKACADDMNSMSMKKDGAIKAINLPLSKNFITELGDVGGYCGVFHKITVAGTYEFNGVSSYVVVSEIFSGNFFDDLLVKNYDGYVIVPSELSVRYADRTGLHTWTRNFAFVSNKSEVLLFEKKKGD